MYYYTHIPTRKQAPSHNMTMVENSNCSHLFASLTPAQQSFGKRIIATTRVRKKTRLEFDIQESMLNNRIGDVRGMESLFPLRFYSVRGPCRIPRLLLQ